MSVSIDEIENREELTNLIIAQLKEYGIKYKQIKPNKKLDKVVYDKIFYNPLQSLPTVLQSLDLNNHKRDAHIPIFVVNACNRILKDITTEGLFRKTGSTSRQKQIIQKLERGLPFDDTDNVIDVASILKTFFRSLPEPMIPPGNIQEAMIRSLVCDDITSKECILLILMLLPPIVLNTLAYFMQFLQKVSQYATQNKMTISNLAILISPNIMPIQHNLQQRHNAHVKIIKMFIENCDKIGAIPNNVLEKLHKLHDKVPNVMMTEKKKKKRRSGSLTRVFNGIRKIVGAIGSSSESLERTPEIERTPVLTKSSKKRKVGENPFSAKKRKDLMSLLPNNGAILPSTTPITKELKKARLSLGGRKDIKPVPFVSIDPEPNIHHSERRFSLGSWHRKKGTEKHGTTQKLSRLSPVVSMPSLTTPDKTVSTETREHSPSVSETKSIDDLLPMNVSINEEKKSGSLDEEYIKVPRIEYEAFKDRVTAIEQTISNEFNNVKPMHDSFIEPVVNGPNSVEEKFQKTMEDTHPINETACVTDTLAKRLSKELKIRRSTENQIIRSPSARKIGAIRRRSKENGAARLSRSSTWHFTETKDIEVKIEEISKGSLCLRSNLKRGRPNTYERHPSPIKKINMTGESEKSVEEQWHDANSFFNDAENDTRNMSTEEQLPAGHPATPSISSYSKIDDEIFKTPNNILPKLTLTRSHIKSVEKNELQVTDKTPMLPPSLPIKRASTQTKKPLNNLHNKTPAFLITRTPIQDLQSGRASIARIRANVGHVAAKAKLFDNLNGNSGEAVYVLSKTFSKELPSKNVPQKDNRYESNTNQLLKENDPPTPSGSQIFKDMTPKRKHSRLTTEAARRHKLRLLQPTVVKSPIGVNRQRRMDHINSTKLQKRLESVKLKNRLSAFDEAFKTNTEVRMKTPTKRSNSSLITKSPKSVHRTPNRAGRLTPVHVIRKSPRFTLARR